MLKKLNVKTIVTAIVFGGTVSLGTYFLLPPPQNVYASNCATYNDVVMAIRTCLNGAQTDENFKGQLIATNC